MATVNPQLAERNAAAKKARLDPRKVLGPFNPTHHPVRTGLYLRQSAKTGQMCWAHFDAQSRKWGLYSDTKDGALRRRAKVSKKRLPWFAYAK